MIHTDPQRTGRFGSSPRLAQRFEFAESGYARVAVVSALLVSLAFGLTIFLSRDRTATEPHNRELTEAELQAAEGLQMGDSNAPILLEEFADYECPSCAAFATSSHGRIREELIETGRVRLIRYDLPLTGIHPRAFLAARAARCAGEEGAYWAFHDSLYELRDEWSVAEADALALFEVYAEDLGLAREEFSSCLRSNQHADEVTRNLLFARSLGIRATPTHRINGLVVEPVSSFEELEGLIGVAEGSEVSDSAGAGL